MSRTSPKGLRSEHVGILKTKLSQGEFQDPVHVVFREVREEEPPTSQEPQRGGAESCGGGAIPGPSGMLTA